MGRIAHATLQSGYPDGHNVFDQNVNVGVFPRLARIGSAYQRYRFTRMEFDIQPMCPATAGGGYIAAFLKDPLDSDTSFDALQGSHGAVMAKWWEHKTIHVPNPGKDLLWTSLGENARLYSPGKLVLTTVGSNDALVNISVLCRWEVELSVPSLEEAGGPITEYITYRTLYTSGLTNESNEFSTAQIISGVMRVGTILRTSVPFAIDYKLGAGDVTKADYTALKVVTSPSFPTGVAFQWGTLDVDEEFHPGAAFYYDEQPLQVVIAEGTKFNVIFDPNA